MNVESTVDFSTFTRLNGHSSIGAEFNGGLIHTNGGKSLHRSSLKCLPSANLFFEASDILMLIGEQPAR